MSSLQFKVPIEKSAHDAFKEIADTLWGEHGVIVDEVSFSWSYSKSSDEPKLELSGIEMRTSSNCRKVDSQYDR